MPKKVDVVRAEFQEGKEGVDLVFRCSGCVIQLEYRGGDARLMQEVSGKIGSGMNLHHEARYMSRAVGTEAEFSYLVPCLVGAEFYPHGADGGVYGGCVSEFWVEEERVGNVGGTGSAGVHGVFEVVVHCVGWNVRGCKQKASDGGRKKGCSVVKRCYFPRNRSQSWE